MNNYTLTNIFIYPVKSLGGISLQSAEVEERGLRYDRRWMIVDESNKFITQRLYPQLALVRPEIKNNLLTFSHFQNKLPDISVPLTPQDTFKVKVQIWNDNVTALQYTGDINNWFSKVTGIKTRLVFMPDETRRVVDPDYAKNKIVSFADGYPFLIAGKESLNEVNRRMEIPLPLNRFRANFTFSGGKPFDEDNWNHIKIGDVKFNVVKSCARCVITTVDQSTGEKGEEPLTTLAKFRKERGKVMFGQNMVAENTGKVSVGDRIEISTFGELT